MAEENFIYLVWKDQKTNQKLIVGRLEKQDGYSFSYVKDYKKACSMGWDMLRPFPEEKMYKNEEMFPIFSSRLPDPNRRDIGDILQEYGMKEYDEYELLKRSGAALPIDSYEFIDPDLIEIEREIA